MAAQLLNKITANYHLETSTKITSKTMVNGKIIKQAKNFNCLGYDMSHKDDKDQIPKRSQSVCVGGGGAIKRGLKTRKA
jgi:hypothetical protein